METLRMLMFGMSVAVGIIWEIEACGVVPGLGMSTKAMLNGVGVDS